jgi:LytS/YehU family sensor histidine kinase
VQILIGVALALIIRLLIYLFGEPYLQQPLDKLFLVSTWLIYVLGVTIINGIFITTYFISRWKDSIREAERLEKEKAIVQFDNLKNQLNPHFLFNALSSLNSLIAENQQLASEFLQQLSKIYRYILQNKDKNLVSLQTELDFIHHYVLLAETRFQNSLKFEFDVPLPVPDKSIVPVTLQVLIENALKHNRIDEQHPLRIRIHVENNYLEVSNNFQPRKIVDTSNKQGLENLKSLYRFYSSEPVHIEQSESTFNVKIPLLDQ